ncbi:MAG: hypothetical protein IJ874_07555 [Ruminococcus sp.]|nr:hypothetical protein [Ruminococcus sp.]
MKIRCPECGIRLSRDSERCNGCGAVLYQSIYADIAEEVEAELKKVTIDDIRAVAQEKGHSPLATGRFADKLTLEEFEEALIKSGSAHRPGRIFVKQYELYERKLKRAYEEYLKLLEK